MDSVDPKSELVERSKKASKRSTKSVLMGVCIVSSSILEIPLRYNDSCQGTSPNWIWEYPNPNRYREGSHQTSYIDIV